MLDSPAQQLDIMLDWPAHQLDIILDKADTYSAEIEI